MPPAVPDDAPHLPSTLSGDAARLVIAGLGLITPLGETAWTSFSALLAGRTLADRAAELPEDTEVVDRVRVTGSIASAQHTAADPVVELAERASREATTEAGVDLVGTWAYLGTSKGAVHALLAAAQRHGPRALVRARSGLGAPGPGDAHLAVCLGPHGYLAHHLVRRTGVSLRTHRVAACASGLAALDRAATDLADPRATHDTALVVTAESALSPVFIHSYRRLGVLADPTPGGYRQRPLDHRRAGFVLSELGAAVVLRRLPPGEVPRPGQIELVGVASANEAADLIRPAAGMPALRRVARAVLPGDRLDVLHPHAPGTPEHDPAELDALGAVVGEVVPDARPSLYAVKGALGHSLGAAGLASLVVACLCVQSGRRPAMPWIDQPLAVGRLPLRLDADAGGCDRGGVHAVFAAGFGGHTAGAAIRRHT